MCCLPKQVFCTDKQGHFFNLKCTVDHLHDFFWLFMLKWVWLLVKIRLDKRVAVLGKAERNASWPGKMEHWCLSSITDAFNKDNYNHDNVLE